MDLIAREGWKLLPLYRFDPVTGLWQHRSRAPEERPSLRDVLASGRRQMESAPESVLPAQLKAARQIVAAAQAGPPGTTLDDPQLSEEFERIRWFPLPGEGLHRLRADGPNTRRGGSHGTRTICVICLTLMWLESALGFCLGCKIHGLLVGRGWVGDDPEIEVCADGSCAPPAHRQFAPTRPQIIRKG